MTFGAKRCGRSKELNTGAIITISFRFNRSRQTAQTQNRLLQEISDLRLQCLHFRLILLYMYISVLISCDFKFRFRVSKTLDRIVAEKFQKIKAFF